MLRILRMFRSSSDHFSSVRCPKLETCSLLNCIFDHTPKRKLSTSSASESASNQHKHKKLEKNPQNLNGILSAVDSIKNDLQTWGPKSLPGIGAPAKHQQRMRYITALIDAYRSNNIDQPISKAVEAEFEIAKSSKRLTYDSSMKKYIRNAKLNKSTSPPKKAVVLTRDEFHEAVKLLVHPIKTLERNGYATEIPEVDPSTISDIKICNRCSEPFSLEKITEPNRCRFHERKKKIENNGKYWECCSEVVGETQGCKTSDFHVFKAQTFEELHSLIKFKETPSALIDDQKRIIGLDCEMGYTSKGLELIRLTIVDFYSGEVVFDEITRPYGQMLDLNTQWSGVSEIPPNSVTLDQVHDVIFNSLIDKDTIIVGHGLENDLNVLRLVHHNVVDTAVLFPKSLDRKFSLKELSFQILDRVIQTGEHSSEEDSLAAIDIIKAHVSKN